jgi:hypothetical protein
MKACNAGEINVDLQRLRLRPRSGARKYLMPLSHGRVSSCAGAVPNGHNAMPTSVRLSRSSRSADCSGKSADAVR